MRCSPLYLAPALGLGCSPIGAIEGIAEATALITKVFSGVLSDVFGRASRWCVLGYGLAAVTKLVFPLASTLGWVVAARFADRVGKGIRGAPRDALIADIAPEASRGASFGLRQALDTVGALGGPLLAIAAMAWFAGRLPGRVLGRGDPGVRRGRCCSSWASTSRSGPPMGDAVTHGRAGSPTPGASAAAWWSSASRR